MKVFVIKLIVLLLMLGCKQEEFVPCETPVVGSLNVNTNYPDWINSSCWYLNSSSNKIHIRISSIDALCSKDELDISSIEMKLGKFEELHSDISQPNGYTSFIEYNGEDAIEGIFKLLKVNSNFIKIESIDTFKDEIKGSFNLTFIPDSFLETKFKDTVYFKNSSFTAKLVK